MQVLLNTDTNVHGGQPMIDHLEAVLQDALSRFGEHITRVDAHLMDAISQRGDHLREIHCTLEAKLVGLAPVVVKAHATNAHQAIQEASSKLQRAVSNAVARHDSRRQPASPDVTAPDIE